MKLPATLLLLFLGGFLVIAKAGTSTSNTQSQANQIPAARLPHADLGFDTNDYPGDSLLPQLRRTFSFAGYWLNSPPGAKSNTWLGKRETLDRHGFGFLILFNGRTYSQLKTPNRPNALGARDARAAVETALREGFPKNAIIFLDQEEGGRLLPDQNTYLFAWIDAVISAGFRAGVYCSGIPATEGHGQTIVTANDIRNHAGTRKISYFIYNDACPPSPGCAYGKDPPAPSLSGVPFASIWQMAQSPRRKEFTAQCSSTYGKDGDCDLPGAARVGSISLDLDSATTPDPSNGR
jgi:glycoside hydrolase-like protein